MQLTRLQPGGDISEYINNFELLYQKLNKIPLENMRECDAKSLFARNILDPALERLKEDLLETKSERTLEYMILKLRLKEVETSPSRIVKRAEKRTMRLTPVGEPTAKRRHKGDNAGTGTLPSAIRPNLKGILRIPPRQWKELCTPHRDWVLLYNRAIRRHESPPSPPAGVSLIT